MCFACMNACAPYLYLVPNEVKRGCQSPWNQIIYRMVVSHHGSAGNWTQVLHKQVLLSAKSSLQPPVLLLLCVYVVCVYVCVRTYYSSMHVEGGQRKFVGLNALLLPGVLRTKLRSSGLYRRCLYPVSHLCQPHDCYSWKGTCYNLAPLCNF